MVSRSLRGAVLHPTGMAVPPGLQKEHRRNHSPSEEAPSLAHLRGDVPVRAAARVSVLRYSLVLCRAAQSKFPVVYLAKSPHKLRSNPEPRTELVPSPLLPARGMASDLEMPMGMAWKGCVQGGFWEHHRAELQLQWQSAQVCFPSTGAAETQGTQPGVQSKAA